MYKVLLYFGIVISSTPVLATQYMCDVARGSPNEQPQYTSGVITDDGDSVSYVTQDNKDRYTSGTMFEMKKNNDLLNKEQKTDNVAFCTNVQSTSTEDNFGNKSFKFKNTVSGESLTFYNCKAFEQPEAEDVVCDVPAPEPSVCPATEPKKIGDQVPKKPKKSPENTSGKAHKPKNPFGNDKPKPKRPTPDNMCPT